MEIKIEIPNELDLEQEKRFIDYLYFKILDDHFVDKLTIKSEHYTKEKGGVN